MPSRRRWPGICLVSEGVESVVDHDQHAGNTSDEYVRNWPIVLQKSAETTRGAMFVLAPAPL